MAIALLEFLQKDHADTRVQIFATDVSESAIEFARAGVYPASIEADVSAERLRRFFTRVDGGYRVTKTVRDLCVFARQDLTRDPPFSHLDLILCRNVLIYMDAPLQRKLLSVFHYALKPGGFLVLGQAESVGRAGHPVRAGRQEAAHLPQEGRPDRADDDVPRRSRVGRPAARPGARRRRIADRDGAPGRGEPRHPRALRAAGRGGRRRPADRPVPRPDRARSSSRRRARPSLNLLKMAREGLLYGLRTALQAARKSRARGAQDRPAGAAGTALAAGRRSRSIPLADGGTAALPRAVRRPGAADGGAARPRRAGADAGPARGREGRRAAQLLQRELAASREYLQSIIQELEAANEELQSANEEILSSNEELQSTNEELDTAKEELQSTNEELNTVNDELHGRNEELSRVNSDLINLLASVQIAIVIVSARPAHPPLHADGREGAEPDPGRHRPRRSATSTRTSTAPTSSS